MSLARLYHTKKVQKDWTCGKCGATIRKGVDGRVSFAVGFRGFEQTRCLRPECYPKPSERESSMLADIYAVQEGINWDELGSLEDIETAVGEVQEAVNAVKDEYESNEMYDINEQLQERVSMLEEAADSLDSWQDGLEEAPEEEPSCEECEGTGQVEDSDDETQTKDCDVCNGTGEGQVDEDVFENWLEEAREAARSAVDEMDLP